MPNLAQPSPPGADLVKMIYIGDSGTGKTGSLAPLAAAGYNIRVLDLDKGINILKDYVTNLDPKNIYTKPHPLWPEDISKGIASRVDYVQISETFTNVNGQIVPRGDSWDKMMAQLTEWKDDGGINLGKLETWTGRDILVIDSFSRVASARMYKELVLNARAVAGRQQSDYFKVQEALERFLDLLVMSSIKCHVILICHIEYVEKDDKTTRGMPQAMGKALGPKIGQYFNHALLAKTQGSGAAATYKIFTKTQGMIDLKNAAPLRVEAEYPLETGLLQYFNAVVGPLAPKAQP